MSDHEDTGSESDDGIEPESLKEGLFLPRGLVRELGLILWNRMNHSAMVSTSAGAARNIFENLSRRAEARDPLPHAD